jgi:hypothetical protein
MNKSFLAFILPEFLSTEEIVILSKTNRFWKKNVTVFMWTSFEKMEKVVPTKEYEKLRKNKTISKLVLFKIVFFLLLYPTLVSRKSQIYFCELHWQQYVI